MPPRRKPTPSYLPHKQSGRARAVWTDRTGTRHYRMLPGQFDSSESRAAFARLQLELEGRPSQPDYLKQIPLSVANLFVAFMDHAERYYRHPDGSLTSEVGELKWSIKPVRGLFGFCKAAEFGPKNLATVRQHMIKFGWCRSLINRRIDRVKRIFKWAASEELVPVTTYEALRTLPGLRRGRTEARESKPIKPVDPNHVKATIPFLTRHLRAMVELQQLTGMRPGEVCQFRLGEVDRSGEVWLYRPSQHKTAHHGKSRIIPIGPRGQRVITDFLLSTDIPPSSFAGVDLADHTTRLVAADAFQECGRERDAQLLRDLSRCVVMVAGCIVDPALTLFSPYYAREERFRLARRNRKSKVTPSQLNRRKPRPQLLPASEYTPHTYAHAVRVAARKAGVPHWHPNQIRHTFATEVRKQEGLEAAQVMLGHSRADVTQVYAEKNEAIALRIARKMG